MTIRFGRAITNPLNGSRHTPLQVTFRIPPRTSMSRSGTYGLNGSQYLDSSDESEVEDEISEDPRLPKTGTSTVDSPRVTVASNKESLPTHPNSPKLPPPMEVRSTIVEAVPAKTQKPSKRSTLAQGPSKSTRFPHNRPFQPYKKSGHPSQSLNDSLPPPYDHSQSPHPFDRNLTGNPHHPTKPTELNDSHLDEESRSYPDNEPNGRGHQEAHDKTAAGKPPVIQKGSSRVQPTPSEIAERIGDVHTEHDDEIPETLNVKKSHHKVSDEHSNMQGDVSKIVEKRSGAQDEEIDIEEDEESDIEEDEEDEEDSQRMCDGQDASSFENLQAQADHAQTHREKVLNQNDGGTPIQGAEVSSLVENRQSSQSSPPTSTEGAGSLMTTSEQDKGMKKQNNYVLARPTYKDVSVVTTITSKTQFTESLNRLPDSLERTFQVSLKLKPPHSHPSLAETITEHHASNRLPIVQTLSKKSPRLHHPVQPESRNVHQPNQIPSTEHLPASTRTQSPLVPDDGTMITPELKRKRSPLVEEEEEEEESMESAKMAGYKESVEEELDGKRSQKRVKLANDDTKEERILCSHCSKEMNGVNHESMRRKLRSRVLAAARSVAIFALGGVATVAGILAFENVLDEQ